MIEDITYKTCSKCGEEKPLADFYKNKNCKDGYRNVCKTCCGVVQKKYNNSVKPTYLQNRRNNYQKNKEKILQQKKNYYEKNSSVILEKVKKWRKDNPTKIQEWKENNKETINQSQKEYRIKRMETDILYKTKIHIRKVVGGSFNRKSWTKNSKTFDILGCDVDTFMKHIENQFQDGMTWDNYGKKGWNYDHIIPLASAKTEEELIKLNHYTNFQPLWWYDNLIKSDKLIEEIV